jgi:hypothetical protein
MDLSIPLGQGLGSRTARGWSVLFLKTLSQPETVDIRAGSQQGRALEHAFLIR